MAVATTLPSPRVVYTSEGIYPLTVDQYHELIVRGTLTADDEVELVEGVLLVKISKNPPHSISNGRLQRCIASIVPSGWCFRSQEPVTLPDGEPEPDGVIARCSIEDYKSAHPAPSQIGLLIEVADSTLDRDRGIKLRSYARAGVGCYWIINLIDRQLEVHTDPDATAETPRYRATQILKAGDAAGVKLDGVTVGQILVSDILPPA